MLVSARKRKEWSIPLDTRVLPICWLDLTTVLALRTRQLKPHEVKLRLECPKQHVLVEPNQCIDRAWWVKTVFSVVVCNYPRAGT